MNVMEQDKSYSVCTMAAKEPGLRLFWKGAEEEPYRSFTRLTSQLDKKGEKLVFGMNAGMYHEDASPVGLYVEDGEEMKAAKADWQFVDLGGAVHCFTQPESNSPPNCVYNERAAMRAARMMRDFFRERFGS